LTRPPLNRTSEEEFFSKKLKIPLTLSLNMICRYMPNNIGFSIYYDKVHKKEYLPSRVRYNQFFFYAAAFFLYLRLR
jgi:hypothetical protein